jgi:prepilin-type N-terminal cleavage/methylation domain-containing protein
VNQATRLASVFQTKAQVFIVMADNRISDLKSTGVNMSLAREKSVELWPPRPDGFLRRFKPARGFSLVELLITMAIMGVIVALTIPPLFQVPASKQGTKYNAMARDTAFMVSSAYQQYKMTHATVPTNTNFGALTPYMNYLATDATTVIDSRNNGTTFSCAAYSCLKLHNGATLLYANGSNFGGSTTTNALYFYLDPDGQQTDGTTNGPGKSVVVWLQYNGTLHSWGTLPTSIMTSVTGYAPTPSYDPIWFTGF